MWVKAYGHPALNLQSICDSGALAGLDEAGRGCLAGPVVAAAVILPPDADIARLTDSKKLTAKVRQDLVPEIKSTCLAWSLGLAWPREIDRINILQATMTAMKKAVLHLVPAPKKLLVDGNQEIPLNIPQKCIVGGDMTEPCISAASIMAKTFRDMLMAKLDRRYPGYGLGEHKGYGTRKHLQALKTLGPSPMHRKSFKGGLPRPSEKTPCLPIT
ncbi:ribonuclease HII [Desulfonatronospira sp.]|uniref:ribonuclease HII n=1 Tax=Desulfonatronospira sp. TaxID=1962951 RepID=UPI0025C53AE3|nr:ribonuclease HII [Desulfonatronospira sp.]